MLALVLEPVRVLTAPQHKGEVFDITDPVEAPFAVEPLPALPDSLPRMMYIWVTGYVTETLGFAYQRAGVLVYTITAAMVRLAVLVFSC